MSQAALVERLNRQWHRSVVEQRLHAHIVGGALAAVIANQDAERPFILHYRILLKTDIIFLFSS